MCALRSCLFAVLFLPGPQVLRSSLRSFSREPSFQRACLTRRQRSGASERRRRATIQSLGARHREVRAACRRCGTGRMGDGTTPSCPCSTHHRGRRASGNLALPPRPPKPRLLLLLSSSPMAPRPSMLRTRKLLATKLQRIPSRRQATAPQAAASPAAMPQATSSHAVPEAVAPQAITPQLAPQPAVAPQAIAPQAAPLQDSLRAAAVPAAASARPPARTAPASAAATSTAVAASPAWLQPQQMDFM